MSARILVVDDSAEVRALLVKFLELNGYQTECASNGREALASVYGNPPDLVLLDVEMPVMNGFETCRRLKENERTALIPITMLTGLDDRQSRRRGIEAGADDFLSKPFDEAMLRARIRTQLSLKRITDQLERTETVIFSMARWVEMKDQYTEAHLRRVAGYSEQIAQVFGFAADDLLMVRYAGILHDIGKIGVPEAIVSKPGPLSSEERIILQRHPDYGAEIIAPLRFSARVAPLVRAHHEHWDGRGYPRQLKGEDIPLGARIISVVDGWDAMTTDRPYRKSLEAEEAVRRLRAGSGTQWDPEVIRLFMSLYDGHSLTPVELPGFVAEAA